VRVEIVRRAELQVERLDKRWRARRDKAPELFKQELADARLLLSTTPHFGAQHVRRGERLIRRIVLPKTKVKLFYWVDEKADTVWVIAAWGGQRGRDPKL
jgi:hypothetical protein